MVDPTANDLFLTCLPFTLAQECPYPKNWSDPRNFSNDPGDPGGKTMCGIIQVEYNAWQRAHDLPVQDVRKLLQDPGYAIYRQNYWLPHCPTLPPGFALIFFDDAVNQGSEEAIKILQTTLGIPEDGQWGPQTQAAVARMVDIDEINAFTARREAVYRMMPSFARFGRDWIDRSVEIKASAVKMIPV
jgi:lysozyme family protein